MRLAEASPGRRGKVAPHGGRSGSASGGGRRAAGPARGCAMAAKWGELQGRGTAASVLSTVVAWFHGRGGLCKVCLRCHGGAARTPSTGARWRHRGGAAGIVGPPFLG